MYCAMEPSYCSSLLIIVDSAIESLGHLCGLIFADCAMVSANQLFWLVILDRPIEPADR